MKADAHFRLRIPHDLKRQIEGSAAANHRSINAEILQRLQESFTDPVAGKEIMDTLSEYLARTIHEKVAERVQGLEEELSELRRIAGAQSNERIPDLSR